MIRVLVFLIVSSLVFSSNSQAYQLQYLEKCNQVLNHSVVYSMLSEDGNSFSGWSHVQENKEEYDVLLAPPASYQIDGASYRQNKECDGSPTLDVRLLVKLSDWTQQHPNGLEAELDSKAVNLGGFGHLVMDFKLVSEQTSVASERLLAKRYREWVSQSSLSELDDGLVTLGFTLFEDGALDQSSRSLNVETKVTIDQNLFSNKWLRLIVSIEEFTVFYQRNYTDESADLKDSLDVVLAGFRVTAETRNGKQLRNILADDWRSSIPETFNEVGLQIRRVELVR